jgi:hypothetical protein
MPSTQDLLSLVQAEIARRLDPTGMAGVEEHSAGTEKYRLMSFDQLTAYEDRLIERLAAESGSDGGFSIAVPLD